MHFLARCSRNQFTDGSDQILTTKSIKLVFLTSFSSRPQISLGTDCGRTSRLWLCRPAPAERVLATKTSLWNHCWCPQDGLPSWPPVAGLLLVSCMNVVSLSDSQLHLQVQRSFACTSGLKDAIGPLLSWFSSFWPLIRPASKDSVTCLAAAGVGSTFV